MLHKKFPCTVSLVLLVVFIFPTVAIAVAETAESLLEKLVSNIHKQSYKASAVFIRPSGMESINLDRKGEIEKITFNNNDEKEQSITLFNNKEVYQVDEGISVHHNKTPFIALKSFQEHLTKSLESYDLFISRNYDQVAGIQTTRLSVISKNNDRYSYIYWIDSKNYIVLRADTLNEHGELIERMVLTSLALTSASEHDVKANVDFLGAKASHYYYEKIPYEIAQSMVQWQPSNFTVSSIQSIYDDNNKRSYKFIVLSDGFASIGIYIGHHKNEAKLMRGQQLDAFKVFRHTLNGNKISVEGQLPYEILEKVGLNIMIENNDD